MLLFMESILVLALWFSSGKILWFFRPNKQKTPNRVSSANGSNAKTMEENDVTEDEEAVESYKVTRS